MIVDVCEHRASMLATAHRPGVAALGPELAVMIRTLQRCELLGLADLAFDIIFGRLEKHVQMRRAASEDEDGAIHAAEFRDECIAQRGTLGFIQPHGAAVRVRVDPASQAGVFLGRRRIAVVSAGMDAMIARAEAALVGCNPLAVIMTDAVNEASREDD